MAHYVVPNQETDFVAAGKTIDMRRGIDSPRLEEHNMQYVFSWRGSVVMVFQHPLLQLARILFVHLMYTLLVQCPHREWY